MLTWITWIGDMVALFTGIAMIKDVLVNRASMHIMWASLVAQLQQARARHGLPNMNDLRPILRFCIRVGLLVMIVASAGVCVAFPPAGNWQGMLLRTALALHMATHVPCPWFRWITVGDTRAKLNDPPGVERRVHP